METKEDTMTFTVLGERVAVPVTDLAGLEIVLDADFWAFIDGDEVLGSDLFTLQLEDKIRSLEDRIDRLEMVIANLDNELHKVKQQESERLLTTVDELPKVPQVPVVDPMQLDFGFGRNDWWTGNTVTAVGTTGDIEIKAGENSNVSGDYWANGLFLDTEHSVILGGNNNDISYGEDWSGIVGGYGASFAVNEN